MTNDANRYLENLSSQDRGIQNEAYNELLTLTSEKVEWTACQMYISDSPDSADVILSIRAKL